MCEKILYYSVQKGLMYEDYFDITLSTGQVFRWKNFGQVITIDEEDARKKPASVEGAVIKKERFQDIEILKDYYWFINSQVFYEEPTTIIFKFPFDEIAIIINHKYETRLQEYPERDYFWWINEYKLYNDFKSRLDVDDEKAIKYLKNWSRPRLKTNAEVKAVVYHNSEPVYVALLDSETKKTSIDAFFRMIYYLQFLHGE